MTRENLSPTHLFEELQRKRPAPGDPWQRRSPKALTPSGRRKRVRIVNWLKDDKAVMRIVVRDDNSDRSPRTRTVTLRSFVLAYEPGDEILEEYERVCLAKPAPTRRADLRAVDPRKQRVFDVEKRLARLKRSRWVGRR